MICHDEHVDPLGLRATKRLVSEGVCRSARYFGEAGSTNTMAIAELQSGELTADQLPKLFLADRQTAGRGRHGRSWLSSPSSLTFSLVVARPPDASGAFQLSSLAVGVSIARTLEYELAPTRTKLKWPNDVYLGGGKVAGILLEGSPAVAGRLVIGVGVNIDDAPDLVSVAGVGPAQSILKGTGRHVHRYELLGSLVEGIIGVIGELPENADSYLAEFRSRCMLTGNVVCFEDHGVPRSGNCLGIAEHGELIVRCDGGIRHLQSGEARLVRVKTGG